MMANKSTTRLGNILLKKGLITADQLHFAVNAQTKRRQPLDPLDTASYAATSLGEILIELGFIDRLQLNRGLNWQAIIRKMTLAMTLCAPMLTVSYEAAAAALPLTIQAENYSAMKNVKAAATNDVGGGSYVGWIDATDWMSYAASSVDIPATGSYKITYRVASLNGGGSLSFHEADKSAVFDIVPIPSTQSWEKWVDVTRTVTLTAGIHTFGLTAINGGFSLNWFKIESLEPIASLPRSSSTASSSSLNGLPSNSLSLTIQAENYSTMKDVQAASTTDVGGGLYVGWIDANDWMSYATTLVNIPTTGDYKVTYRVASLSGGGSLFLHEVGSNLAYDTVYLPRTGGWETWVDVQRTVTLTAGVHKFGLTAIIGGFSLNWFKIESSNNVTVPSSGGASTSSSGASSSALSNPVSSAAASSKPASSIPASSKPMSSTAASSTPASSIAASSVPSSTPKSSTPTSSAPASSNAASAVPASSKAPSSTASSVVSAQIAGPVEMSWVAPTQRENGSYLDAAELGGYELRYKLVSDIDFTYISINDPLTNFYNFTRLEGNYIFQIAAFDNVGRYSKFVDVVRN